MVPIQSQESQESQHPGLSEVGIVPSTTIWDSITITGQWSGGRDLVGALCSSKLDQPRKCAENYLQGVLELKSACFGCDIHGFQIFVEADYRSKRSIQCTGLRKIVWFRVPTILLWIQDCSSPDMYKFQLRYTGLSWSLVRCLSWQSEASESQKLFPPLLPSQKSEGPRNSAWLMPGLFVHYLCICRFKDTLCVFLACSWHCRLDILTSCAGCCSRSRRSKPVADVSAISKHATCGQDLWDLPSDFSRESDGILVVISQPPGRCWDVHLWTRSVSVSFLAKKAASWPWPHGPLWAAVIHAVQQEPLGQGMVHQQTWDLNAEAKDGSCGNRAMSLLKWWKRPSYDSTTVRCPKGNLHMIPDHPTARATRAACWHLAFHCKDNDYTDYTGPKATWRRSAFLSPSRSPVSTPIERTWLVSSSIPEQC